jgi:hypothetical protein
MIPKGKKIHRNDSEDEKINLVKSHRDDSEGEKIHRNDSEAVDEFDVELVHVHVRYCARRRRGASSLQQSNSNLR